MASSVAADNNLYLSESEERTFVLVVEGAKLYISKETLAIYSPVFKKMFYGNFKEAEENCVELKDKKLSDVLELLQCLMPYRSKREINEDNVNLMLQFADEYDIHDLRTRCEKHLMLIMQQLHTTSSDSEILDMLHIASTYRLSNLLKICIKRAASLSSAAFKTRRVEFPTSVAAAVFEAKLSRLELQSHEISDRRKDPFFCSCRYCNTSPSSRCVRCKFGICALCKPKHACNGFHSVDCRFKLLEVASPNHPTEFDCDDVDCLCGYDFDESLTCGRKSD